MLALETKNLDPEKVTGNDVRVLATYAGTYQERVETEHTIPPELQDAIDRVRKVLK